MKKNLEIKISEILLIGVEKVNGEALIEEQKIKEELSMIKACLMKKENHLSAV